MKSSSVQKFFLFVVLNYQLIPSYSSAFVGINGAYLHADFNHTLQQRIPVGPVTHIHDKDNTGSIGADAGYQFVVNKYNVSFAGFYNWDHLLHTMVGTTTTTKKYLNYDYGAKIIPGFYLVPALNLEMILGFALGQFKYEAIGTRSNYINNYSEPGILLGAGFDYRLIPSLHSSLSFEYTGYRKKNNVNGDAGFYQRNGSAQTNRVLLTISYFFGQFDKNTSN